MRYWYWYVENLFNETLKDGVYFQTPGLVMAIAGDVFGIPGNIVTGLFCAITWVRSRFLVKVPTFRNLRFYFLFLFLIFIPSELNHKTLVFPFI